MLLKHCIHLSWYPQMLPTQRNRRIINYMLKWNITSQTLWGSQIVPMEAQQVKLFLTVTVFWRRDWSWYANNIHSWFTYTRIRGQLFEVLHNFDMFIVRSPLSDRPFMFSVPTYYIHIKRSVRLLGLIDQLDFATATEFDAFSYWHSTTYDELLST